MTQEHTVLSQIVHLWKQQKNAYAKYTIFEPILKYKNNKANKILESVFYIKIGDIRVGKSRYKVRVVNIKTG